MVDLRKPLSDKIIATDASTSFGLGVSHCRVTRDVAAELMGYSSSHGDFVTLLEPVDAGCTPKIAKATLDPNPKMEWDEWTGDYSLVRDLIEATYPDDFHDFNKRMFEAGGSASRSTATCTCC